MIFYGKYFGDLFSISVFQILFYNIKMKTQFFLLLFLLLQFNLMSDSCVWTTRFRSLLEWRVFSILLMILSIFDSSFFCCIVWGDQESAPASLSSLIFHYFCCSQIWSKQSYQCPRQLTRYIWLIPNPKRVSSRGCSIQAYRLWEAIQ